MHQSTKEVFMSQKTAFITGATAGIGQSTALLLAKNGWNLILSGRREKRLEELKNQIEERYETSVTTLCFDVSDRDQCEKILADHKDKLVGMTALINNAGLARGVSPMDQASIDDWEQMIDTNVKGLLYVTRLSLPFLKNNSPAHIINIGSVAGRWTYPGGNVYSSTKFAVRAISESLRLDLIGSGIRVTNIAPGMVETEFSLVRLEDQRKADAVYKGFEPLTPEDISECIEWSLSRPQRVNIQEMVIYPTDQASVTHVHRS